MIRKLKNLGHLIIALLAISIYRFPGRSMTVIGITGTDGKTTTTHLIYEILRAAGKSVSMISTVSAIINNKNYDTGLHVTTPSPFYLQKLMREAKDGGSDYFVLEVTSHGLDQNRVFGSSIDVAVITNISHEHLDYHGSLANYQAAKAKILKGANIAVLNRDDKSFEYLKANAKGKIVSFGIRQKADSTLSDYSFKPKLLGDFNLYNCLASATVAKIIDIDTDTIAKAVCDFPGVPGRMEEIKTNGINPRIFIDFAHKPNALREALITARENTKNKLIAVFGAAGLRDSLKRPIMGEIAASLSDYIVLTAEDPRTEDVRDIINQIAQGCLKGGAKEATKRIWKQNFDKTNGPKYFWKIPDRQEAINFAIKKLAKHGDLVIICGKGHEQSMCYGTVEYPWDDKKAVLKALYGSVKNFN